jgi:hypothetical protein
MAYVANVNRYYKISFIYFLFSFIFIFAVWIMKKDYMNIIFYKHLESFLFISCFIFFYHLINKIGIKYIIPATLLISVLFKLLYGFWHHFLFDQIQDFPFSGGLSFFDEMKYYKFAKEFYLSGGGTIFDMVDVVNFPLSYLGYPYILYLLYDVFGVNLYIHILLNTFFMSFATIVFYKLFIKLFNFSNDEKILLMGALLFSPALNLYAVQNLKDALLTLETGISIYAAYSFVYFSKTFISRVFYILLFFVSVYSIYFCRVQFSFLMFLYLIIMIYYNANKYLFFLFFSIFVFYIATVLYEEYEKYFVYFSYDFLNMQFERMQKWSVFQNKLILMIAPILAPFAIFLPLPLKVNFESNSAIMNMNSELWTIPLHIELTFLYVVIVLNFHNILKLLKSSAVMRAYKTFLLVFVISLYITNYITYERHKLLFTLMSMPFFVKSFSIVLTKKTKQLLLLLILLATLSFVYSIVRVLLKGEI